MIANEEDWRQRLIEACKLYSIRKVASYLGFSQSIISQVV